MFTIALYVHMCVCVCWCACVCTHVSACVSEKDREKDRRIANESEKAGDDQAFATPNVGCYSPKNTHTPTHPNQALYNQWLFCGK